MPDFVLDNNVDVYGIRTYRKIVKASYDWDDLVRRIGPIRVGAHYDPTSEYTGFEWGFRDSFTRETFLFFIMAEYTGQVRRDRKSHRLYVSNHRGGMQLVVFRDWITQSLAAFDPPGEY